MYVKKKKNASGSTSVLVVSKDNHRRHRLVKNMGCGNTPSEISVLVSSAKEYIANTKGPFPVFRNEAPQNNKHSFWRMDNVIKHLLLLGHLEHDSLFDS